MAGLIEKGSNHASGASAAANTSGNDRARFSENPRFTNQSENRPTPRLPSEPHAGGIHAQRPICSRLKPSRSCRNAACQ